jgi:hypothetical protein
MQVVEATTMTVTNVLEVVVVLAILYGRRDNIRGFGGSEPILSQLSATFLYRIREELSNAKRFCCACANSKRKECPRR